MKRLRVMLAEDNDFTRSTVASSLREEMMVTCHLDDDVLRSVRFN